MKLKRTAVISIKLIFIGVVICSLIYPVSLGGIGQIWSNASQGSIVKHQGEVVGSRVIGQQFSSPHYFHGRPSSIDYDASRSGSANLGPSNPKLEDRVEKTLRRLKVQENLTASEVPADLTTESGSALDPHITPEAALLQVPRIAKETGIAEERLRDIIQEQIKPRFLGIFGMRRVNVLELNLRIEEVLNQ